MTDNPTHDPGKYSRELIQELVRPGLEAHLEANFNDPQADRRGTSIDGEPGEWPPLVVTELPGGGRVLYPHVVVSEASDDVSRPDQRKDFHEHSFAIGVEIHATTATQMFNLRDTARAWFVSNEETLEDAGFAEPELSGNAASWDQTSKTSSWELTVSGLVHTHPDSSFEITS